MAAFAHHQATGQPITADGLADHLAIPPTLAGQLLTPWTTWTAPPRRPSRPSTAPLSPGAARDRIPAPCWLPSPDHHGPGTGANTGPAHLHAPASADSTRARRRRHCAFTAPDGYLIPASMTTSHRLLGRHLGRPARLHRLAGSHLARRRMHPPHPPARADPPRRPRHRGGHPRHCHLGAARRDHLQSLRQPPRLRLPVLRRNLPPRRLPAHPRRADRRQRHPRDRRHPPGRVRHLHRPLLRPRPHPARPAAHLHRQGPLPCRPQPCHARRDAEHLPARPAPGLLHPPPTATTRARPAAVPGLLRPRRPRRVEQRRRGTVAAHQASHRTPPGPPGPPPRLPSAGPYGNGRYGGPPSASPTAKPPNTRPAARSTSTSCSASTAWTPRDPDRLSAPAARPHRRRPRGRHPPRRRRHHLTRPRPPRQPGRLAHRLGRRARRPGHHHARRPAPSPT